MNELKQHKKSDKIKWVFTGIAFVLVFVMLAGVIMQIFGKGKVKPSEWFNKTEIVQTQAADNDSVVFEQVENNGVQLLSSKVEPETYADYGISEHSDSVYQVTATIQPADASLQSGTFKISFKDPSSAWANGKNIDDYAEVIQNGLTATFVCKQAFAEQILLTFTADKLVVTDTAVSATCSFDYCARVIGVSSLLFSGEVDGDESLEWVYLYDFGGSSPSILVFSDDSAQYEKHELVPEFGIGSIRNNFTYLLKLKLASDMISTIQGITGVVPSSATFSKPNFKTTITSVLGNNAFSTSFKRTSLYNAFASKFTSDQAAFVIEVIATDTVTGTVCTVELPVRFNPAGIGVKTTSASLSKTNVLI